MPTPQTTVTIEAKTETVYTFSAREKILKQLKHTITSDFTTYPQRSPVLPSVQKNLELVILTELRNKLSHPKNQTAPAATGQALLQKKTSAFVQNSDMIGNTPSTRIESVTWETGLFKEKVPIIYELNPTNGGFYPMSQDLTRFTDLSNPANFEKKEAIQKAEKQPAAAVAVVEQAGDSTQQQFTQASATERAKQAFQEYGAAVTSPSQPSSFSTFTATPQSPSVEQVIMEQQAQHRKQPQLSPDFLNEMKPAPEAEFSSNVKTLIRLVNELPEGVTKQTGACIIRLTMEAMGIAMEEVLGEGQNAQSELLENVRMNIKKIEEYKTVIRKLETDIKYFQGRANELSEIIDLFILSNASRTSIEN